MKVIKAKIDGNETLYIIKRKGFLLRKVEVYWLSQNMALPVVDVSSAVQNNKEEK